MRSRGEEIETMEKSQKKTKETTQQPPTAHPQQWKNATNTQINRTGRRPNSAKHLPHDDWPTPEILNKKLRQAPYVENVVNIYKSLNASFSIHILNSNIEGNEKKQIKLKRKIRLRVIGARVYFPKSILPISLDPRKSHDPKKSILPISLTKIPFTHLPYKNPLQNKEKRKILPHP